MYTTFSDPQRRRQSPRAERVTMTPSISLPLPSAMPQGRRRIRAGANNSSANSQLSPKSQHGSEVAMAGSGAELYAASAPQDPVKDGAAYDPLEDWSAYGFGDTVTETTAAVPADLQQYGARPLVSYENQDSFQSLHDFPTPDGHSRQSAGINFDDFRMDFGELDPMAPAATQDERGFNNYYPFPIDFTRDIQGPFGEQTRQVHGYQGSRSNSYNDSLEGFADMPRYGSQLSQDQPAYPVTTADRGCMQSADNQAHSPNAASQNLRKSLMGGPPSPDDKQLKHKVRGKDKISQATRSGGRKTVDTGSVTGNQKLAPLPREEQNGSINKVQKVKKTPPPLKPSGLYFSSAAEARQSTQGLKWDPRDDDTLPKTQEDREAIVARLLAAMQDMSEFQDKKGPMFNNRWVGPPLEEPDEMPEEQGKAAPREATDKHYTRWDKEAVCWAILDTAERIYREGTAFISIHDSSKLEECEEARDLTFKERIDTLEQVFRQYKARVDKLLGGGVTEQYVLCPGSLIKVSKSNRGLNDVRSKDIAAGRERDDRPSKKKTKAAKAAAPASVAGGEDKRKRDDFDDPPAASKAPAKKRGRKA